MDAELELRRENPRYCRDFVTETFRRARLKCRCLIRLAVESRDFLACLIKIHGFEEILHARFIMVTARVWIRDCPHISYRRRRNFREGTGVLMNLSMTNYFWQHYLKSEYIRVYNYCKDMFLK